MNKKTKIILLISLIGIILVEYDFLISEVEVVGTYVNNNFDEEPFYAEVPYIRDTLKLNLDKTFTSKYYGNGIYEISSDFFGSELSLSYENKMGKGGANFPLKDKPFQSVKIMLSFDLDYYYEKISH